MTSRYRNVLLVLGSAVVGAVAGCLVGATVGGNYAVHYELAGVRGYEATGLLGALFGATLLAVASAQTHGPVHARRTGRRQPPRDVASRV